MQLQFSDVPVVLAGRGAPRRGRQQPQSHRLHRWQQRRRGRLRQDSRPRVGLPHCESVVRVVVAEWSYARLGRPRLHSHPLEHGRAHQAPRPHLGARPEQGRANSGGGIHVLHSAVFDPIQMAIFRVKDQDHFIGRTGQILLILSLSLLPPPSTLSTILSLL